MRIEVVDVVMFGNGCEFAVVVDFEPNWFAKLFGAGTIRCRYYSNLGLTWVNTADNKAVDRNTYGSFNWKLVDFLQACAAEIREQSKLLATELPDIEQEDLIH